MRSGKRETGKSKVKVRSGRGNQVSWGGGGKGEIRRGEQVSGGKGEIGGGGLWGGGGQVRAR